MPYKDKILIPIVFWGDEFLQIFKNIFYPNLKKEFKFLERTKIEFQLWTTKKIKGIINNDLIKLKNLTNTIIEIDELLNKNKYSNKYNILLCIQKKILIKAKNYKKVLFLYPDFIWKEKSIINLLKIKKKIVNIYCPQINIENYLLEKKPIKYLENFIAKNLHHIVKATIIGSKNNFRTAATNLLKIKRNAYIFKNFHVHPIMFNNPDFSKIDFRISLDEDLYSNYLTINQIKLNDIYYQKNSSKFLFASLEKEENLRYYKDDIIGQSRTVKKIAQWVTNFCSEKHIENSKNCFFLNHKYDKSKMIKFNKYFDKIYKELKNYSKLPYNNNYQKKNITHYLLRRIYFLR
jgi:hypothetical protein